MKKTIAFLLGVATIVGTSMPALAKDKNIANPMVISSNVSNKQSNNQINNEINNEINNNLIIKGKVVNIAKAKVVINKGNVMVPLKLTAESLGFKVSEDANSKIITLDNDQIQTKIKVGVDSYYYSSSHAIGFTAPESFGAAPMLVGNVVYVPIKIYNLLFNDTNSVGSFFCEATDGQLVYVNNEKYTIGRFVDSKSNDILTPTIGMPSPIKEFKTVQEAQKSLKFKTVVPKVIPAQYKVKFISTINDEIFQIGYNNGKKNMLFRMAQGIDRIDGDYNEYKFSKTIKVNGINVNLKGSSKNLVNLATYKIKDMSYSISVTDEISEIDGISENDITKMIKSTF